MTPARGHVRYSELPGAAGSGHPMAPVWRRRLGFEGPSLVLGAGLTGCAAATFLARLGLPVELADERPARALPESLPPVPLHAGGFPAEALGRVARLVVSPGIPPDHPFVGAARARGLDILGDMDLFDRCAQAPIIGVTGSNGKSTVVSLLGEMARAAGLRVGVGGNIGRPALELLGAPEPDLHVLELSSFQLERTGRLGLRGGAILNVSPDHLDRYPDVEAYLGAKRRIWRDAGVAVVNRDDARLREAAPAGAISFGGGAPRHSGDWGLCDGGGRTWLVRGEQRLLALDELRLKGRHNGLNALAALALGEAAGLGLESMLAALRTFAGLPHRVQWIGERRGAVWYNDSKGTNVGATQAAIDGLEGPIVLIAGGVGKGQDFTPLAAALKGRAREVILIGRDADRIAEALRGRTPFTHAKSLEAAVERAGIVARPGDVVLLSPACASLDGFPGFEARGEAFVTAFQGLEP